MNWLAWRQHRKQFIVAGIFLILFAAFMIPSGLSFWHTYKQATSTCNATNTCDQLGSELFQSNIDGLLFHLLPVAIMFAPVLLGLFWGVPLLTKEYTEGTNKLVWTQSISRRKWLSVKLTWILTSATIVAGGLTALDTWWARAGNALNLWRFGTLQFSSQGIVLIGYAVFAVSLGIFLGALFKRTMVAIGVTLILLIAIIMVIVPNFIRPYYETPVNYKQSISQGISINGSSGSSNNPINNSAILTVSQTLVSKSGEPINWTNPPVQCIATLPNSDDPNTIVVGGHIQHNTTTKGGGSIAIERRNNGPAVSINCLSSIGYQQLVKYQPSYRYWDFQRIESGLYLALSVIPIGATYWLVLKRDA